MHRMNSISRAPMGLPSRVLIAGALLLVPISSFQAQTGGVPNAIDEVQTVEGFEDNRPKGKKWNLVFKKTPGVRGYLTTSALETPPAANSERYMSINFLGKRGNGVRIVPPETRELNGYVREIRVWVFGFNKAHELYVDITDIKGTPHRLFLGNLKFSGWKLLKAVTPKHVRQRGTRIADSRSGLIFRGLFLLPRYRLKADITRLYLDEIQAIKRPYHRKPPVRWRY